MRTSKIFFGPVVFAGLLLTLAACSGVRSTQPMAKAASLQPATRIELAGSVGDRDVLLQRIAGEFALSRGDLKTAARYYSDAASMSDDPLVAEQATQIAVAGKQWEAAQKSLERWKALASDRQAMWQAQASISMANGQIDSAYTQLLRLAREPDGNGWSPIGQVLLGSTNKAAAGDMTERLAQRDLLGDKAEVWVAVSQLAYKLDHKPFAEKLAEQALAIFHNADAYAWAARLAMENGEPDRAKALLAAAVKHDGNNARLRNEYAALLGSRGENTAAAHVLAQGLQDDYTYGARAAYATRANDKAALAGLYTELEALSEPRSGARLNLLGQIAELIGRVSQAKHWYGQIQDDDEHWVDAQTRLAVIADEQGELETALASLHELQARTGDDAKSLGEVFLLEGELLHRHGRDADALEAYQRGLQSLPDDTRLLYARALINGTLDRLDESERDLRQVVELKPDDADALNALGYTLADRTDRKEEALALIEKALKLKPEEPAIIDSLGWVQYRRGNLAEAIEQLKRAYSKQPDAEIAAHLGEVLWVSGQKDEAKKIWEQGRKKDGKNKLLLKTMQRLEI